MWTTELSHIRRLFDALEQASSNQYSFGSIHLVIRGRSIITVMRITPQENDEHGPVWLVKALTKERYVRTYQIGMANAKDFQLRIRATDRVVRRHLSKHPTQYLIR